MKLTNKTDWNTEDLRAIIKEALKRSHVEPKGYNITITHSYKVQRGFSIAHVTGTGWYGQKRIHLRLPRPELLNQASFAFLYQREGVYTSIERNDPEESLRTFSEAVATVTWHEAQHNKNFRHKDMQPDWMWDSAWARSYRIRVAPEDKKTFAPKPDKRAHAAKMLEEKEKFIQTLEKTLKRTRKLASKWRQKVRYHEKKAASKKPRA